MTMLEPLQGQGWNAAHRALINGYRSSHRSLNETDRQIEAAESELAALRVRRGIFLDAIEEFEIAIDRSGYVPAPGFNKWGVPSV